MTTHKAKSAMTKLLIYASSTLLASTTLATDAPYVSVPDESHLPLLNPDLQERQTLKLRLANGVETLLISDPKANPSAACVWVGAGSWNDPEEYPGMAHFCEHMLFMGTQKYPNENEFSTTVSNYAGFSNAFTAPNRTVYMFEAQSDGFLLLLDQFAHFFIDPLFNPSGISRELHAVDQEFAKNLENDRWRQYMVFKETGNPEHPNRLFSTGNSQTLGRIPQSALKQWHSENYGAEKMHLVLYSSLPLDALRDQAVALFNMVPQSMKEPLDFTHNLSSAKQRGHITYVKPIQKQQSLSLSWELPADLATDETQAADLVAFALRRGQKFSLYEKLKTDLLIDTMSTQIDELGGKAHRFFEISLELTQQGLEQLDTVIFRCFEAIAGLKETSIPAYLLEEKNTMAQLNYQYQSRQDPFEYVKNLAEGIAEESLSTYPRNTLLSTGHDPAKIAQVLKLLTPDACAISLLASPELTKVMPNVREKWFGTEYAIRPIPNRWLSQWAKAKPNPQIRLAEQNPYLPTNLALIPDPKLSSKPIAFAHHDFGTAYYVREAGFGSPHAICNIWIRTPHTLPSARNHVLASLYVDHFTDMLHPTFAAAAAAGLHASIDLDRSMLHIQIAGYSEKAPLLLQEIVKQMAEFPPTQEQFQLYFARHEKAYQNAQKELAVRQAKDLLDSILNQDKSTNLAKLHALQDISFEAFATFHKELFERTYMQGLFAGNLSLKEAESAWLDVIHALGHVPYPKEEHATTKVLHLPSTGGPFEISQTVDAQGNAAILVVDEGAFTFERRAVQEILSTPLKEAFFNELRTKQKTGYIAHSAALELENLLFQYFLVQSNSHQPNDLLFRFEQFIEEFNDALAENISEERFETIRSSLITSLQTRFHNLADKTALWANLAFERDADFDFVEKRIEALSQLSYDAFLKQAPTLLSRDNRKRLAVLAEGRLASPFHYHPIELAKLAEVVTYAPRPSNQEAEE